MPGTNAKEVAAFTGGRNCRTSSVRGASPARRSTVKMTTAATTGGFVNVNNWSARCDAPSALALGLRVVRSHASHACECRRQRVAAKS